MFVLFQICWWRPERVWSVPELRRAHGDVPLLLPGRLWTQPAEVSLVEEVTLVMIMMIVMRMMILMILLMMMIFQIPDNYADGPVCPCLPACSPGKYSN